MYVCYHRRRSIPGLPLPVLTFHGDSVRHERLGAAIDTEPVTIDTRTLMCKDLKARLPNTAHTDRPWRIHELAEDFRLEDVWALPTPGARREDFPRFVQRLAAGDPAQSPSRGARALWALRWKLGELLGWDSPHAGLGSRVPTLRERLPADLREGPSGPDFQSVPFKSLFMADDEWAAEIANRTVHGVLHLGWVAHGEEYRGQMAVLVKPNGLLGEAYLAAIRPFRYSVIYPRMLEQMEREWKAEMLLRAGRP